MISTPKRFCTVSLVSGRTRSAPQTMNSRPERSSASEDRAYWLTKVSVDKSTLAPVSRTRVGTIL